MKKSIFDFITENIATNSPKDVIIHERTLADELIESEKEGDPFALYDFLPKSYRGKNLVLTRYLIYVLRNFILFFIAVVYAIYDLLHKILYGKWKSKPLDEEVKSRRIPDKKWIKRLHPEKWRGIQSSSGLNAIILAVTLIISTILLAWGNHFLIKEVMLSDNDCRINHYGIVTFDQGCFEEQHFFLLNAAKFWTNTGIAVTKGDRVYITASGSMYSDVDEMVDAANNNKALLYPRSNSNKQNNKKEKDAEYCIYGRYSKDLKDKNNMPVFGSLLYQICDEVRGPKLYNDEQAQTNVRQINFNKNNENKFSDKRFYFDADMSGILYFSFNDILLDDSMIKKIVKNKHSSYDLYNSLLKEDPKLRYSCDDIAIKELSKSLDSLIWFEDNIGEALVNTRVEKSIWNTPSSLHRKLLTAFYRKMSGFFHITESRFPIDLLKSGLLVLILVVLLWFGIDAFISNRLKKSQKTG